MYHSAEIQALLHLIDDPDEVVFESVCNRFVSLGRSVLLPLDEYNDATDDALVHERIAHVVHKVNFEACTNELKDWATNEDRELLAGAMLLMKFVHPDTNPNYLLRNIENIRRSVWLELNSYLTPLEKIKVITTIFFKFYKLRGTTLNFQIPQDFTLHNVIIKNIGNSYPLSILYASIASMLDIPLYIIKLPNQNLLAYFNEPIDANDYNPYLNVKKDILFFVNPVDGSLYNWENVEDYQKKLGKYDDAFFKPQMAHEVLKYQLQQLAICYRTENNMVKYNDLQDLIKIVEEIK